MYKRAGSLYCAAAPRSQVMCTEHSTHCANRACARARIVGCCARTPNNIQPPARARARHRVCM